MLINISIYSLGMLVVPSKGCIGMLNTNRVEASGLLLVMDFLFCQLNVRQHSRKTSTTRREKVKEFRTWSAFHIIERHVDVNDHASSLDSDFLLFRFLLFYLSNIGIDLPLVIYLYA